MAARRGIAVIHEGRPVHPPGKNLEAAVRAIFGIAVIALALVAGVRALRADAQRTPAPVVTPVDAARWPATFEGRPLERVALHPVEARFAATFPGAFAAFSDGRRRIVFRRIDAPTRMVHPAEGCLRAAGYVVRPAPALRRGDSGLWSAVDAAKDDARLSVREQINDPAGRTWTDVSAWYWAALMRPHSGPWTAVTVFEPAAD